MKTVLLCLVLLGSSFASKTLQNKTLRNDISFRGFEVVANVNAFIDASLVSIIYFLIHNGFDPMTLPRLKVNGWVTHPYSTIAYEFDVESLSGTASNLRSIRRLNDVKFIVDNSQGTIKVSISFALNNIVLDFERAKIMSITYYPIVRITGGFNQAKLDLKVVVNMKEKKFHLLSCYLYDIGWTTITFIPTPHEAGLVSTLIDGITTSWKTDKTKDIQYKIKGQIAKYIDGLNIGLNNPVQLINLLLPLYRPYH